MAHHFIGFWIELCNMFILAQLCQATMPHLCVLKLERWSYSLMLLTIQWGWQIKWEKSHHRVQAMPWSANCKHLKQRSLAFSTSKLWDSKRLAFCSLLSLLDSLRAAREEQEANECVCFQIKPYLQQAAPENCLGPWYKSISLIRSEEGWKELSKETWKRFWKPVWIAEAMSSPGQGCPAVRGHMGRTERCSERACLLIFRNKSVFPPHAESW